MHHYTGALPGGWAWTDLPGGVPDADDTSGAVLALSNLDVHHPRVRRAAMDGLRWLGSLQNRDGGTPTFCRGWGRLPFDKSCADITAHCVLAHVHWSMLAEPGAEERALGHTAFRADSFLTDVQREDGSWTPLWFGNQHLNDEENPLYGTARVMHLVDQGHKRWENGRLWLTRNQNEDGGWGGGRGTPSSIEETALAVEALARAKPQAAREAVARGVAWLVEHTRQGTHFDPAPIGFYFAKLWYFERLYPIIFTVAALERVATLLDGEGQQDEQQAIE